jgi:hypothetical protein
MWLFIVKTGTQDLERKKPTLENDDAKNKKKEYKNMIASLANNLNFELDDVAPGKRKMIQISGGGKSHA